ncbi:hypothetical protein D0862_13472 [Hortaea werneckii]|uniref:Uncharacterized protein n=1 Tax=Hortaea werneckii TaxID=91943 RepID=A0A3M7EP85_HORWE|nr:hypothetical protein D0862_13472 [Hortaea werneckii]
MDFRIEVVDNIEAQVEEMMRLGALGYFKKARQVSQSIALEYQQNFEVAFEQLRLMLDQGAYTDLIARAMSTPKQTWTPAQRALISMLVAIARMSMSGTEGIQASDAFVESKFVGPSAISVRLRDRLGGRDWTIEEVHTSSNLPEPADRELGDRCYTTYCHCVYGTSTEFMNRNLQPHLTTVPVPVFST